MWKTEYMWICDEATAIATAEDILLHIDDDNAMPYGYSSF